ncbi:MAG: hypothetical protein IJX47_10310 [Clostridia bacterium]|nr:hypothetical protein [Clostridia bacterium]
MREKQKKLDVYITEKSVEEYIADETCSPRHFIRQIFLYLRAHPELCEIADYRRLYDETLEYWINDIDWTVGIKHDPDELSDIEFLADLFIKYPHPLDKMFTRETVDQYLDHRRAVWRHHSRSV